MCQTGNAECLLCVHTITPIRLEPPFEPRRPCNPLPTIAEQIYYIAKGQSPPTPRHKPEPNKAVL